MIGMTVDFKTRVETSKDELNDPVYSIVNLSVPDCLVAPITEPTSAREQQAMDQSRDQVRVHFPKNFTGEVDGAWFAYRGKIFQLDSSSVSFMDENTPTRWNRYTRAESVGRYDTEDPDTNIWLHFFVTEDSQYILVEEDETP